MPQPWDCGIGADFWPRSVSAGWTAGVIVCRLLRCVVKLRHHGHEPPWPRVREWWPGGPGTRQGESPRLHWRSSCVSGGTAASYCCLGDRCWPRFCQDPTWCILGLTRIHGGPWPNAPALVHTRPQNASHIPTLTSPGGRLQRALLASLVLAKAAVDVFQGHLSAAVHLPVTETGPGGEGGAAGRVPLGVHGLERPPPSTALRPRGTAAPGLVERRGAAGEPKPRGASRVLAGPLGSSVL